MSTRINLIILISVFSSLLGCTSKLIKPGKVQKAQWSTKAVINNIRENKSQSLNIDIFAIKYEQARFEISAMLGFQVASVVMSPKDISYIIFPQKTFFRGPTSDKSFSRMISLQLNPMNLTYIAFDEPIRGPGWKCSKDLDGLPLSCENEKKSISVKWSDRESGKKKVSILAPQFEMQWKFSAPQTEVQFKSETFTLNRPEGFKLVEIK